jgi:transcriptional regulator with XRE-family HTH domain
MGDETQTPELIGGLIARTRAEQGITQLRLAERICASAGMKTVTRHEISRWERGERVPSGYWLTWLAEALKLPLDQLERAAAGARRRRSSRLNAPPDQTEFTAGVSPQIAS